MSEYMFGGGPGYLSQKADRAARKHGAGLVNYTDAECLCGRGCRPHTCKRSRRHWFAGPNRGDPFDGAMAAAVLAEPVIVAEKERKRQC